jgi:3'(2'), 5'-bisphosphate nucleotidase
MKRLAEGLFPVALAAARVQMSYFTAGVEVERKADHSPVTAADRKSEEIILEALARLAPGVPVIAEEAASAGSIPDVSHGAFFLVDPLDGTNGFTKGRPAFTINVALIEERRPAFGLVYAPAMSDFYVTLGPAEVVNAPLDPHTPARALGEAAAKPIRSRVPDPNALAALVSQSHLNRATERFLEGYDVIDRRAIASSIKFALIARGEADLYPRAGPTSEWDTAAGHAILTAAGGTVTRLDGTPLLYGNAARKFENPNFVAWGREPLVRKRD